MRSRSLLVAGVAAAALLAGGVAVGRHASAGSDRTLRAHERFTKLEFINPGRSVHTFGEHAAFRTDVNTPGGSKLGIGIGDCVRLTGSSVTEGILHCTQTYHLEYGDVFVGGLYDLAGKTTRWAILGGTRGYRGATGEEDFTTSDGQNFDDVFQFSS
jgi:hypothetical protein